MTSKMSGFIKFGNASFRDFCSSKCAMCINIFKWVPVLFIAAILGWSYYAFVIQLCFYTVDDIFKTVIYLLFYHFLLIMFTWSYWLTIFTEIGQVPSEFKISQADAERLDKEVMNPEIQEQILEKYAKDLPVLMRSMTGGYRYCNHCHHIKPDRAHHCSVCKTCLLKMDHHCPWVNNCVSFTNYKFFLLFLFYGLLYCLFIAATTLEYFILFWRVRLNQNQLPEGGRFHILFLFMVAIMFALSLGFLSGYHLYLVLLNRSTLESFRAPIFRLGPDKNGFSLGKMANFQQIFGEDWRFWLVPIFTSLGTGITYPTRSQGSSYHSMGVTNSTQQASINSQGEGGEAIFPQEDKGGLLKENSVPVTSTDTSEDDSSPYNKGDMTELSYKMAKKKTSALL